MTNIQYNGKLLGIIAKTIQKIGIGIQELKDIGPFNPRKYVKMISENDPLKQALIKVLETCKEDIVPYVNSAIATTENSAAKLDLQNLLVKIQTKNKPIGDIDFIV
jgi:hypothetical protein